MNELHSFVNYGASSELENLLMNASLTVQLYIYYKAQ